MFQDQELIPITNRLNPEERTEIKVLIDIVKKQQQKILSAYCHFAPEQYRKLLKDLITANLDLAKAKKQRLPVREYRRQFDKFNNELEEKTDEKTMEKVEFILTDCDELASWELDLEEKKQILLEENQQINISIQGSAFFGSTTIGKDANFGQITYYQETNETKNLKELLIELEKEKQARQQAEERIKELEKLQEKDSIYQELARKKASKEQELNDLKNTIIINNKITDENDLGEIEEMLKAQTDSIKNKDLKRLKISKKRLAKMKIINELEIEQFCQLQTEITQLELELNKNVNQSTKQLTRIINNINNIKIGDISFDNVQIDEAVAIGMEQIADVDLSTNQIQNWTNIHPNFTPSLINQWKINNFTYEQTQEWINIGLTINDSNFCAWLRDTKHLTAEECLNYHDLNQLKSEYQAQLLQAQIQISPKN